jgi:hypothetical protein
MPESSVSSTEQRWVDFAVSQGLVQRSVVQTTEGQEQRFLFTPHLNRDGLSKFVRADRATLVRLAASQRGRDMATVLGLHVFDIPQLAMRESGHAWLPASFAHIGGAACTAAEVQAAEQLKSLRPIPAELANFLRQETVLAPSDYILAALVNLHEHIGDGSSLPKPLATVLASDALIGLLLAAIADAQVLDHPGPSSSAVGLRPP